MEQPAQLSVGGHPESAPAGPCTGWGQLAQGGQGFPEPARAPGAAGTRSQAQDVTLGCLCRADLGPLGPFQLGRGQGALSWGSTEHPGFAVHPSVPY